MPHALASHTGEVEIINLPTSARTRQSNNEINTGSEEDTDDEDQDKSDFGSMVKDGGRGRGAGRGRGRSKKNTGTVSENSADADDPDIRLPITVIRDGWGPQTQYSPLMPETQMPPQTSSQPQPTTPSTGADVADDDTEDTASATADTRPLLICDEHDYQPPNEAIEFWWEEWLIKEIQVPRGDEANMRKDWEIRAAKRHRRLMHNIRRRYVDFLASPEYQAMRRANKANRACSTGGSLHTGGLQHTRPLRRRW
ncbi:hypothetical protein PIB30_091089 [Stylosanthes scabra]|uniref:Uncharacterized protein n=1 Tax=Stylosanthes scabra TaxID=79078 RepID=A0ABU6TWF1_9FABA|nr:hypothetical protein [Stylosanthes scabra]